MKWRKSFAYLIFSVRNYEGRLLDERRYKFITNTFRSSSYIIHCGQNKLADDYIGGMLNGDVSYILSVLLIVPFDAREKQNQGHHFVVESKSNLCSKYWILFIIIAYLQIIYRQLQMNISNIKPVFISNDHNAKENCD